MIAVLVNWYSVPSPASRTRHAVWCCSPSQLCQGQTLQNAAAGADVQALQVLSPPVADCSCSLRGLTSFSRFWRSDSVSRPARTLGKDSSPASSQRCLARELARALPMQSTGPGPKQKL